MFENIRQYHKLTALSRCLAWAQGNDLREALMADFMSCQASVDAQTAFAATHPSQSAELSSAVLAARMADKERQKIRAMASSSPDSLSDAMVIALHAEGLLPPGLLWILMSRTISGRRGQIWPCLLDLDPTITPPDRHFVSAICACDALTAPYLARWMLGPGQNPAIDWRIVRDNALRSDLPNRSPIDKVVRAMKCSGLQPRNLSSDGSDAGKMDELTDVLSHPPFGRPPD